METELLPVIQEAGWAPGPVWTIAENLAPTGIRSPDRPARIESLWTTGSSSLTRDVHRLPWQRCES